LGDGTGDAFWSVTGLFWIFGSILHPVTRQGVALRRAQHEAIFGRQ
jgi:hypothetical protein